MAMREGITWAPLGHARDLAWASDSRGGYPALDLWARRRLGARLGGPCGIFGQGRPWGVSLT